MKGKLGFLIPTLLAFYALPALADGTPPAKIDTGDTAWVLASSALVLLMTPGLAFFYGGMVRTKNVLATIFQSIFAIALVGVLWAVVGYSLAFSGDVGGFIGNLGHFMLAGVGQEPSATFGPTIPHLAFMFFQAMFAVITPALITGAFAERVPFKAWAAFLTLWSLLVYSPIAHWVWGSGGWIAKLGGLDFAGGMVVHASAGFSALVAALVLGKRKDFGTNMKAYDPGMVILGTSLLFFGWFGFNSGSALSAGGLAAHAFATSFFAACTAMLGWMLTDTIRRGKPSVVGAGVGVVVGLVIITPAAGFVTIQSALFMGFAGSIICNLVAAFVKEKLKVDDSLDVFACHGIGGSLGVIFTGIFASKAVNPAGNDGLFYGVFDAFKANVIGLIVVALFSMIATYVIFQVVKMFTAIRVSDSNERLGIDSSEHDEYINSNFEGNTASGSHSSHKTA